MFLGRPQVPQDVVAELDDQPIGDYEVRPGRQPDRRRPRRQAGVWTAGHLGLHQHRHVEHVQRRD